MCVTALVIKPTFFFREHMVGRTGLNPHQTWDRKESPPAPTCESQGVNWGVGRHFGAYGGSIEKIGAAFFFYFSGGDFLQKRLQNGSFADFKTFSKKFKIVVDNKGVYGYNNKCRLERHTNGRCGIV